MKRLVLGYALAASVAAALSVPALADDAQYAPQNWQSTGPSENLDVTAKRFHPGTPVAVRGTIADEHGHVLKVARPDGLMTAVVIDSFPELSFYGGGMMHRLAAGDTVTVYGTLGRKTDGQPLINADAVFDRNLDHLFLTEQGTQKADEAIRSPAIFRYHALM
jgi:hypothetical protein